MNWFLRITSRYGRWAMATAYLAVLVVVGLLLGLVDTTPPKDLGLSSDDAGSATDFLTSALMLALATGVLAAALVEVGKRLSALRGSFQLFELREYLREAARTAENSEISGQSDPFFQKAWMQRRTRCDLFRWDLCQFWTR